MNSVQSLSLVFVSYRADTVISAAQHREFSANKKFRKALGEVCRNRPEFVLMPQLKAMFIWQVPADTSLKT